MSKNEEVEDEWKQHFQFWRGLLAHEDPAKRRQAWITLEAMRIARDSNVDMGTAFNHACMHACQKKGRVTPSKTPSLVGHRVRILNR